MTPQVLLMLSSLEALEGENSVGLALRRPGLTATLSASTAGCNPKARIEGPPSVPLSFSESQRVLITSSLSLSLAGDGARPFQQCYNSYFPLPEVLLGWSLLQTPLCSLPLGLYSGLLCIIFSPQVVDACSTFL